MAHAMDLNTWFPAITTTSLFAVALWLLRKLIVTRLTKAVQNEFDTKLEVVRAEFRQKEEVLKADLRSKEADIAALRSGAMSAMASRNIALDKRRLEAVDQLWSAVTGLGPAKAISSIMAGVKFEAVAEEAEKNPRMRQVFEMMSTGFDPTKIDVSGAEHARPFVSPMAWALFTAYRAIAMQAVVKLQIVKAGVPKTILETTAIKKLVKAALPHQETFIDEFGDSGYHWLLDELETRLLNAIREMLSGVQADKATIQQAADIVHLSNEVMTAQSSSAPSNSS
jgi:hypothetical protein